MTEEKQIEDVVDILYNTEGLWIAKDDMVIIAKSLYKANYRRQTEGKWIVDGIYFKVMRCSACGKSANSIYEKTPFCPKCGAKMKGADNEQEEA